MDAGWPASTGRGVVGFLALLVLLLLALSWAVRMVSGS